MLDRDKQTPYAAVVIKLLQGTLEADDGYWGMLLDYRSVVEAHFESFGLALHLDEAEGYAYLSQPDPADESDAEPLPRLVRRQKLSYGATLLCVLLRERLLQFDQRDLASSKAVISKGEIQEMLGLFLEPHTDDLKLLRNIDSLIRQVLELGFLKKLSSEEDMFEIRRIIKAKLSADDLADIKAKLEAYTNE